MKILQIFGAVIAVHLLAFIFIFASPGCQSSPRNVPTPDATLPSQATTPPVAYPAAQPEPPPSAEPSTATLLTDQEPGRATPTRPGSPNAVAMTPPPAPVENVAPVTTYTVRQGDSLWSIAKKNHLTVGELAKSNNLGAGATLQPGKKLIIPGKAPSAAPRDLAALPAKTAPAEAGTGARTSGIESVKHTVLAGESLKAIARKYGVKVGDLAAANGITDPAKIRPGQELIIPAAKVAKPAAKPSPKSPAAGAPATAAAPATPDSSTPHFEIKAPPPGQDLDSGLKNGTNTDVPTIKVDDAKGDDPNKK